MIHFLTYKEPKLTFHGQKQKVRQRPTETKSHERRSFIVSLYNIASAAVKLLILSHEASMMYVSMVAELDTDLMMVCCCQGMTLNDLQQEDTVLVKIIDAMFN